MLIRFFSALMTFPRSGRIAWKLRSRASTAEPPAEFPSTRKSSATSGSEIWQSASLPGSEFDSSALLRRVSSRALRAAWRARDAETALVMIWRASVGFSSRNSRELLVHGRLDERLDRRVPELRLRLALELRVPELHRDDGGQALAHVLALEVVLLLLQEALLAGVAVEGAGERGLEAREVRPALGGVDVVREREDRLDVRAVPLHRDLDLAVVCLALEVHDVLVHGVLRVVHVRHEVADPALVVELLGLAAGALVPQHDPQAAREERRLAQALRQRRRGELRLVEDLRVGQERDRRPRLVLARDAGRLHVARRLAAGELLPVQLAVAAHLGHEPLRERVHDRDANAVQAARDLVALAAELPACVELREHDRQRGEPLVRDHVHRDARAGIANRHRVVRMDGDVDEVVPARESLVDGVVDRLVDEMVEASRARRADVHPGSETDGLEALEDGDVFCGVGWLRPSKKPCKSPYCGADEVYQKPRPYSGREWVENCRGDSKTAALRGRSGERARGSRARRGTRARGAPDPRSPRRRTLPPQQPVRCRRERPARPRRRACRGAGLGHRPRPEAQLPGSRRAESPGARRSAISRRHAGRARTPRWRTRSPRAASRRCSVEAARRYARPPPPRLAGQADVISASARAAPSPLRESSRSTALPIRSITQPGRRRRTRSATGTAPSAGLPLPSP